MITNKNHLIMIMLIMIAISTHCFRFGTDHSQQHAAALVRCLLFYMNALLYLSNALLFLIVLLSFFL